MEELLKKFNEDKIEEISRGEPAWLRDLRHEALIHFKNLPVETSDLFKKYVNIDRIDWDSFELSDESDIIHNDLEFVIPEKGHHILCCNSRVLEAATENTLVFTDIKDAIEKYPNIYKDYFTNKLLKPSENKFVAFNNAFFNSGFFLYVPDNIIVADPIRIINVINPGKSAAISQNIIIIGKNSKATVIEEEYSSRDSANFISNVADVHVKSGGELTFGKIHSLGNAVELTNKKVLLEQDAKALCSSGFFGGSTTLSSSDYVMKGDGSSVDDFEIVFGTDKQNFNISANLFHQGIGTKGRVISKGVFDDKSKGLFRGMINIGNNAKNANAYLAGHSVLLSKYASSDAIPGLEIATNDVKATHSASVAQINDEEIFYLMSRGFNEKDAKKIVIMGFFEPIIRQMHVKDVVNVIKGLFELKWGKQDLSHLKDAVRQIYEDQKSDESSTKDIFEGHYKYR